MNIKRLIFSSLLLFHFGITKLFAFTLEETTIDAVQQAIKNKKITCEWLINSYLDRIKKYNLSVQNAPPLNAFTEINRSVLNAARQLDNHHAKTDKLIGPLHCIPVVLKDNIDSYDTTTTSGSLSLLGTQPTQDAFLVGQLRKAGAIILGKGTMDEFAWGLQGLSSRSGKTGNAYNSSKNAGGSSAGTAVAVSANFTLVGIGTDNSGSVRIPAAFNGLVGLRPSTGLISQRGIYPMGALDGVAGPMTRTVKDLAILLDIIAQPDQHDKKTTKIPREKTYTAYLNKNGLQGKRIGIVHRVGNVDLYKGLSKKAQLVIANAMKKMEEGGASFIPNINLPKFNNNRDFNQAGEIQDINEYLSSFPATRKNFKDICLSNRTRTFGNVQECLKFVNSVPKKFGKEYKQVLNIFETNKNYVEDVMKKNNLDALLVPSGIITSDISQIYVWQAPISSNAGLPAITVNAGYLDNLPLGIELIAKQFDEGKLIAIAYAYEQRATSRKTPSMPIANQNLTHFTIAELNNLFTLIGAHTYEQVIKKEGVKALTPEKFSKIVTNQIYTQSD